MESLTTLYPIWSEAISFALLHSSWLIILYSLLAYVFIKSNWAKQPSKKTLILSSTLVVSFVTFILLFAYDIAHIRYISDTSGYTLGSENIQLINFSIEGNTDWVKHNQNRILWFWTIGFVIFLSKYCCSYLYLRYVKSNIQIEDNPKYTSIINRVAESMNYANREIRLGYSVLVNSPIVIGWIKPAIIFPIGLINELSIKEVEAIIAHEISHLVRKDQFINFLMSVMETIFYFHPAIWWINSQIKKYREEACDDKVIAKVTDKISYVKTLIKLQEATKGNAPHLSLAIKNKPSNFYIRIKRLLDMDMNTKNYKTQLLAICSILFIGLIIGQGNLTASDDPNSSFEIEENLDAENIILGDKSNLSVFKLEEVRDTLPEKKAKQNKKSKIKISKIENDEQIDIEMEDGEVTKLKVDGEEVLKEDYDKYMEEIEILKENEMPKMLFFDGEDFEMKFPENFGEHFDFDFHSNLDSMMKMYEYKFDHQNLDSMLSMKFEHKFPEFIHVFPENFGEHFKFDFNFPEDGHFWPEEEVEELLEKLEKEGLMRGGEPRFWNFKDDGNHWFEKEDFHFKSERNLEELIGSQLNKDGFLIPNKENKVILSGKYLKINGEKQPSNIWNKYKSLFEEETGVPLSKKSKLEFSIIGKDYGKRYQAF